MLPSSRFKLRSPSYRFKMPKRRLTRSRSLTSSPISPRLDRFFKSTKEGKLEMSPKHLTRTRAASSSTLSPDIRRFLSPASERPTQKRPCLTKRRVNLSSVFEYCEPAVVVEPATASTPSQPSPPDSTLLNKRTQPQAGLDEPPAKCIRIENDTEQLMESTRHVMSVVSYKTDLPSPTNPNIPPPPCIKRTWKSGPSKPGVKLFGSSSSSASPRTASKVQMMCRKLWFDSPSSCEIQTFS